MIVAGWRGTYGSTCNLFFSLHSKALKIRICKETLRAVVALRALIQKKTTTDVVTLRAAAAN